MTAVMAPDRQKCHNVGVEARIDPASGLPLPDPFPEYVKCPNCGQAEVEVFCYQTEVRCDNCGSLIAHPPPPGCGAYPFCRRGDDGLNRGAG